MMNMPPGIEIKNLSLEYGTRQVLNAVNLTLEAGTWTGLLGRSGVGKSSLLKVIAGLVGANSTTSAVTASDHAPLTERISYMAQQDLLLPWLSALDNVTLGARLREGRAAANAENERALSLLERVGLAGHANDKPGHLSGGMRQRVALARTLMEERPILLMDEPFSALDAITRIALQDLAADLLSGRTVLLVTHDPLEALRLCHRVHVLDGNGAIGEAAIEFPDLPPRESDDPSVLARQGELLRRLAGQGVAA